MARRGAGLAAAGHRGGAMSGIVGQALGWWLGALGGLVPGVLRRALAPRRPVLLARPGAQGVELAREGALAALPGPLRQRLAAAVRRGRAEVVLAIPAAQAARRRIELPLVAEGDLRPLLGHEIDRLTPFQRDEVLFDHVVLGRRPGHGKLDVELIFAPRAGVAAALAALAEAGLPVARVDLEGAAGLGGHDLRGADAAPPRRSRAAALAPVLALALLLALGAWAGAALWRAEAALGHLRTDLAEARRAVFAAQAERDRAEADRAAARLALGLKTDRPLVVDTLARITALMPDDTWVSALTITGPQIELAGQSADATRLIGLIEAAPEFAEPRFRAPITREPSDGRERFVLGFQRALP